MKYKKYIIFDISDLIAYIFELNMFFSDLFAVRGTDFIGVNAYSISGKNVFYRCTVFTYIWYTILHIHILYFCIYNRLAIYFI